MALISVDLSHTRWYEVNEGLQKYREKKKGKTLRVFLYFVFSDGEFPFKFNYLYF